MGETQPKNRQTQPSINGDHWHHPPVNTRVLLGEALAINGWNGRLRPLINGSFGESRVHRTNLPTSQSPPLPGYSHHRGNSTHIAREAGCDANHATRSVHL